MKKVEAFPGGLLGVGGRSCAIVRLWRGGLRLTPDLSADSTAHRIPAGPRRPSVIRGTRFLSEWKAISGPGRRVFSLWVYLAKLKLRTAKLNLRNRKKDMTFIKAAEGPFPSLWYHINYIKSILFIFIVFIILLYNSGYLLQYLWLNILIL